MGVFKRLIKTQLKLFKTGWLPHVGRARQIITRNVNHSYTARNICKRARNLFISARAYTQPTRIKQILHKVFEKNISNLKFSIVKVSIIVFCLKFLTKGHL